VPGEGRTIESGEPPWPGGCGVGLSGKRGKREEAQRPLPPQVLWAGRDVRSWPSSSSGMKPLTLSLGLQNPSTRFSQKSTRPSPPSLLRPHETGPSIMLVLAPPPPVEGDSPLSIVRPSPGTFGAGLSRKRERRGPSMMVTYFRGAVLRRVGRRQALLAGVHRGGCGTL
jgi:hypothetical protein